MIFNLQNSTLSGNFSLGSNIQSKLIIASGVHLKWRAQGDVDRLVAKQKLS